MRSDFLITDQTIRAADEAVAHLLCGFEPVSGRTSASEEIQEPICSVYRTALSGQHDVIRIDATHPIAHVLTLETCEGAVLLANEDFSEVTVRTSDETALGELVLIGVYSRLAQCKTILVHASLVEIPGVGGLIFVGASGVGKTTQAMLWQMLRGATIINGDKVFLGLREDHPGEISAYGSPWKGNSPYRENRRVPLRGIVALVRREETYIRRLSELEVLTSYVPRVFMPGWCPALTEMVMDTLDAMLPMVPVFEMSCDIDESAVNMVAEAVFGEGCGT